MEDYSTLASFYYALGTNLAEMETKWGSVEREKTAASRLTGLIRRAYEKTRRKVVVLC